MMAARLIRHTARLLAVPVSFPHPSECVRLGQLAPTFTCQAPLHTSPMCRLVESFPKMLESKQNTAEKLPSRKVSDFHTMLKDLPELEDVLNIVKSQKLDGNQCALVIQQITKMKFDKEQCLHDPRIYKLLENMNNQIHVLWSKRLISLVKCLHILGLDSKKRYYRSVLTEVRWRLRKFSIKHLGQLVSYVAYLPQTPELKLLLDDLAKEVELRWSEILDTHTLSLLICSLSVLPESLMGRLEDKVLELAEILKPIESRRILLEMAHQNRRSVAVLRVLSLNLQKQQEFPLGMIGDLAFAFARLNFCPTALFMKMSASLASTMNDVSTSEATTFLRSCSSLRFYNQRVNDSMVQAVIGGKEFTYQQLCSILLSFAHLNYLPCDSKEFFSKVHEILLPIFDSLSLQKQTELVWSLCALEHVTIPSLQKILNPEFCKAMLGVDERLAFKLNTKILNINATALLECPEHWGAVLPDDTLQTLLTRSWVPPSSNMQKDIRDTIQALFPKPDTCRLGVNTIYGWILDAEVILDSNYNPLDLNKFVAPHLLDAKGTEPLPQDVRRFAVVARDFSHYIFSGRYILGRFVMSRRQLQSAGFLVVEVPYYDWFELKFGIQRQSYLMDLFRRAVSEDMAQ